MCGAGEAVNPEVPQRTFGQAVVTFLPAARKRAGQSVGGNKLHAACGTGHGRFTGEEAVLGEKAVHGNRSGGPPVGKVTAEPVILPWGDQQLDGLHAERLPLCLDPRPLFQVAVQLPEADDCRRLVSLQETKDRLYTHYLKEIEYTN